MPPQDHSRDALISTMRVLLRRQGYAATGLKQVLTESGASTGSLYHHFPGGKEELAEVALGASAGIVAAALTRLLDTAGDPAEAVVRWADSMAAALAAEPADGCPIAPTALESVHASGPLRRATAAAFVQWRDLVADRLRRDGRSTADAEQRATAVIALMEGAMLFARTTGDPAALAGVGPAAAAVLAGGHPVAEP